MRVAIIENRRNMVNIGLQLYLKTTASKMGRAGKISDTRGWRFSEPALDNSESQIEPEGKVSKTPSPEDTQY
jgi:hypothetical protein